jgi:hypothetical protein
MYCSLTIFSYIYISLTIFDYQRVIIKYQVFHRPTDQIWNQKRSIDRPQMQKLQILKV